VNLSPNFTLAELARGVPSSAIDARELGNLRTTAEGLERARRVLGVPLVVTSGIRTEERNDAADGSETSSHLTGLAADVAPLGMTIDEAFNRLMTRRGELGDFDQIIAYKSHLHFGFGAKVRRSFYRNTAQGAIRVVLPPVASPADATRTTPRPPTIAPISQPSGSPSQLTAAIIALIGAVTAYLLSRP
jgi:zinc D-Ala-D-Ala carboxypeptidase